MSLRRSEIISFSISSALAAFDFSKTTNGMRYDLPDVVSMRSSVLNEVMIVETPIKRIIKPTKNEDPMHANPTNASIIPIINSLNAKLKLVATAESWLIWPSSSRWSGKQQRSCQNYKTRSSVCP